MSGELERDIPSIGSPLDTDKREGVEGGLSPEGEAFLTGLGLREEDRAQILEEPGAIADIERVMRTPDPSVERQMFLGRYLYDRILAEARAAGNSTEEQILDYIAAKHGDNFADNIQTYMQRKAAIERRNQERGIDEAAIIDETRIAGKREAAIKDIIARDDLNRESQEREVTKKKLEGILKTKVDAIRSLFNNSGNAEISQAVSVLKGDETFLREMEGRGYSRSDITGATYDATITAYYMAERGESLARYLRDQTQSRAYTDSLQGLRQTLGYERAPEIARYLEDRMVSGERKVATIDATESLVRSGRYDLQSTTYDARTGYITFTSKDTREIARIDTSRIPPVIEYRRGPLSIAENLEPLDPRVRVRATLEGRYESSRLTLSESYQSVPYLTAPERLPDSLANERREYLSAREAFAHAGSNKEALETIDRLILANAHLDQARTREAMTPENMETLGALEDPLYREAMGLRELKGKLEQHLSLSRELEKYQDVRADDGREFREIASENLDWLSAPERGYDRLGKDAQSAVSRILDVINRGRDDANEISLSKKLTPEYKKTLESALDHILSGLGYTRNDLRSDRLTDIQERVTQAVILPRGTTGSIESLMMRGGE